MTAAHKYTTVYHCSSAFSSISSVAKSTCEEFAKLYTRAAPITSVVERLKTRGLPRIRRLMCSHSLVKKKRTMSVRHTVQKRLLSMRRHDTVAVSGKSTN